jgi:hypothetical protein
MGRAADWNLCYSSKASAKCHARVHEYSEGVDVMKKYATLVVLALALTSAMSAQAPPPARVDHFRCYFVPQQPARPVNVQLQDQFDVALHTFEKINQLTIVHFCNPAEKIVNGVVTPIVNVNHHLTMFMINQQPAIARTVIVNNQFGNQTLSTADARILMVPTGKGLPPNPAPSPSTDLDHYKCYAASGTTLNRQATLSDQFFTGTTTVLQPVYFCNPVTKIHNNVTTGILNPDIHLVCYATPPSTMPGRTINLNNQFGLFTIPVEQADLLCVPSLKLQWHAVATTASARPQP